MAATCCRLTGEKYFHDLNRAFIEDPAIDEIDIIICPDCEKEQNKADGVVIVEKHKLGVRSWGVQALFLYSYRRLMEHWRGQDRDYHLSATEVIQLSRSVLLFHPECYTAWNIRKELVVAGVLSGAEDLQFSSLVLTKHHRSSETFSHRRWLILQLCKKFGEHHFIHSCLRPELAVCCQAADRYPQNYVAWSHRGWLLQVFFERNRKMLLSELQFVKQWVQMHVSDHCGFHYRQQLLQRFKALCSLQETVALLMSELEVSTDLISAFPGHESVWYQRRFVVNSLLLLPVDTEEPSSSEEPSAHGVSKGVELTDCKLTTSTSRCSGTRHSAMEKPKTCCNSDTKSESKSPVGQTDPLSLSDERAFCTRLMEGSIGARGGLQRKLAASHLQWLHLRTGRTSVSVDSNRSKINHVT